MEKEEKEELFDKNGMLIPVEETLRKKAKEWWIQGFQLNRCYLEHWDEIKETFKSYGVDLNRQGPIITLQSLKHVRLARSLTEKLKKDPEIRKLAKNSNYSLRTVYYSDYDEDKFIEGTIFVTLLRLLPDFCIEYALGQFNGVLESDEFRPHLRKIFNTKGSIIDNVDYVDRVIKKMAEEVSKRKG